MDKSLLLGPLILLCCFRVLPGSLREKPNMDICPDCRIADPERTAETVFGEDTTYKEVVQCRMCHLQFPGEKCTRGRGRCMATPEEACTVGNIFKRDGSLWLTFMGCLRSCANVGNITWSVYLVSFRCCRGSDLCNERL